MAHGLTSSSIAKVHQALHGYADGHRQIALSVPLKPRDQKTLLALSDISGPGAQLDEDGYVTGYPLTDSGFYALARTWPALEMPRPGCVWTHTLLIDFNDLAAVDSPASLLTLFERPTSPGGVQDYAKPRELKVPVNFRLSDTSEAWVRAVIAALYGKPRERIIATRSSPDVDVAMLAIWLQQWPRLRRSFRFCTLAASDRFADGVGFDLQAISRTDRSVRSRFADAIEVDTVRSTGEAWLEDAIQDLKQPDRSGLRSFFRRLGSDVQTGREAFRPLCMLHRTLAKVSDDPRRIHDAVEILRRELGAQQAKTARTLVARAALEAVDVLDENTFQFLWANRGALDPTVLRDSALGFARSILRHAPRKLVELQQDEVGKDMTARLLEQLPLVELTRMLRAVPELTAEAVRSRVDLLGDPDFWGNVGELKMALDEARIHGHQTSTIAAMVESQRNDLPMQAVRTFGSKVTLDALNSIVDMKVDMLTAWVKEAAKDSVAVASFLAEGASIHRSILLVLSQALQPDAVPNDYGDDPWCLAWLNSIGAIDDAAMTHLMVYFMVRALGQRSRSQDVLAQLAFESTHDAAALGRLTESDWRTLEPRLPMALFWLAWDRCHRIRTAVVNLFVDRELSPRSFGGLAKSDDLFLSLAETAAQSYRGRSYLKRVLISSRKDGDPAISRRLQMLERLLD